MTEEDSTNVKNMRLSHRESPPLYVVTVSLGIAATVGSSTATYETVLQQSDKALYKAKDRGRNRVEVFDAKHVASATNV